MRPSATRFPALLLLLPVFLFVYTPGKDASVFVGRQWDRICVDVNSGDIGPIDNTDPTGSVCTGYEFCVSGGFDTAVYTGCIPIE